MKLDRNICSKCGEKNFSDEDFVHSSAVCKECYNKTSSDSNAVELYRSLLIFIEDPFKNNDFILNLVMAFFFLIPYTFEYGDYWFLKGLGVIFAFGILIAIPIEVFFKPFISPEPEILQHKKFELTVDKEVYEDFKPFDIYKEYFIFSKKDKSIFNVLKIEDIEKYEDNIEIAYYNREKFALKLFIIITVWTILITIVVHLLSSDSIYTNNTKILDLKDKNNWVKVSQKSCKDLGGVFSKEENECRAKWIDAKKICRANNARLATFDEYANATSLTRSMTNSRWTSTAVRDFKYLLFNATLGVFPFARNKERYTDIAYTNEISQIGKPLAEMTDKKLIVNCVKGTSNYYLRNFDTK